MQLTLLLVIVATALIGILSGMSLDQAVKQLPARRRIGVVAYSAYSRAADLGNGRFLYPPIGVAALLSALAAALFAHLGGHGWTVLAPLDCSAVLAMAHTLATARAAPINFSQRSCEANDEACLYQVFNRFARWNAVRAALQLANFAALLWATIALAQNT